jgi:hypothetical protein
MKEHNVSLGKKSKNEYFCNQEVTASQYEMLNYSPLAFTDLIESRIAETGIAIRDQMIREYTAQRKVAKPYGLNPSTTQTY